MAKAWYAVLTRPKCELKVSSLLTKKKVESFLPQNEVAPPGQWKKKNVSVPLLPSYVFVYIEAHERPKVSQIDGVVGFAYWLDQPAVVKEAEIHMMKRFLKEYTNVQIEKSKISGNGAVRLVQEPLVHHLAGGVSRQSKVRLLLPSIGFDLVVITERTHLAVVDQTASLQSVALRDN